MRDLPPDDFIKKSFSNPSNYLFYSPYLSLFTWYHEGLKKLSEN